MDKFKFSVISILCLVFSYITLPDNPYTILAAVTVVELLSTVYFLKKINGRAISFASLYIVVLYVFHFGQLILLGLFEKQTRLNELRIVLDYIPLNECVRALRLINIAFVMICLGIMIKAQSSKLIVEDDKIYSGIFDENEYRLHINQAKLMICFTFPIKLFIDVLFLYVTFSQGFAAGRAWYSAFPDIIKTVGNFSLIGFGLLLLTLKEKPSKQLGLIIAIVAYFLILMSSGRRSENVAYLCVFVFLFMATKIKKMRLRKIIIFSILGYVFLAFLYTVVSLREGEINSLSHFMNIMIKNLTGNNIIFQALREYGNTGYTAVSVIHYWLPNHSPSYGQSYYLGISAVIPNIGGMMGELSTKSAYALQLQSTNSLSQFYQNIGGSFIGEIIFNFGLAGGIIASLVFGLILGNVFKKINSYVILEQYNKLMYYIPVMTGVLYWVRDSFQGNIREIVWGMIFCTLVMNFYNARRSFNSSLS